MIVSYREEPGDTQPYIPTVENGPGFCYSNLVHFAHLKGSINMFLGLHFKLHYRKEEIKTVSLRFSQQFDLQSDVP